MMQETPVAGPATPDGDAQKKDRRKNPRRRVLKDGKLIFGQGPSVVDCTIDNMSAGGAHVRLNGSHGLPQEFYLAEASRGIVHKAEVAWRTTAGIGLKLLGTLDDAAAHEALSRKFQRA